jgi:hypothetical protein
VALDRLDRGVAGYGSWPLVRRWALGFEKGGVVQDVYIRFLDGGAIRFRARSFDVNVGERPPLRRTAIEIENNLHREWFDRPENAYMFRPAFREYIAKNFPKPAPAPVAAAS